MTAPDVPGLAGGALSLRMLAGPVPVGTPVSVLSRDMERRPVLRMVFSAFSGEDYGSYLYSTKKFAVRRPLAGLSDRMPGSSMMPLCSVMLR